MPSNTNDDIRTAVRKALVHRGMTIYELAAKCPADQVSQSAVYRFVSGKCALSTKKASVILRVLGLELTRVKL